MIDTNFSLLNQNDRDFQEALQSSDIVLLVYDKTRPETLEKVTNEWIKVVSKHTKIPIILVGNKVDLTTEVVVDENIEDTMRKIAQRYQQCENIIETSAKNNYNLSELFASAQKTVLYPTAPLYDSRVYCLKPDFVKALQRIFRLNDTDRDFRLSALEFARMEEKGFDRVKDLKEVENIFEVLRHQCPEGIDGQGINFNGFLSLQEMMIKRLKPNVCWKLLRKFGYDEDLKIKVEFTIERRNSQAIELSPLACDFLQDIFAQFSEEGFLKYEQMRDIFSTVNCPPWANNRENEKAWKSIDRVVPVCENYALTLNSWMALWHLLAFQNYHNCLLYLVYIGYPYDYNTVFAVKRERNWKNNNRNVYVAYVLGHGRSAFLDQFLGRPALDDQRDGNLVRFSCNHIMNKFLILVESPDWTIYYDSPDTPDLVAFIGNFASDEISDYTPRMSVGDDFDAAVSEIVAVCKSPIDGLPADIKDRINEEQNMTRSKWMRIVTVGTLFTALGGVLIKKYLT